MLKASARTPAGEPVLFLGLTGENVTRMAAGEPVRIRAAELAGLGLPAVEVVLHYGKTEQAILDDLAAHGITVRGLDEGAAYLHQGLM